jgi:hypothetical protein
VHTTNPDHLIPSARGRTPTQPMTIDTERLRELAAELGFWPATTDEADIEHHRHTTRTRTTGWPVVIDSITCAGNTSAGDSVRPEGSARPAAADQLASARIAVATMASASSGVSPPCPVAIRYIAAPKIRSSATSESTLGSSPREYKEPKVLDRSNRIMRKTVAAGLVRDPASRWPWNRRGGCWLDGKESPGGSGRPANGTVGASQPAVSIASPGGAAPPTTCGTNLAS